jgi:hypothetical protein
MHWLRPTHDPNVYLGQWEDLLLWSNASPGVVNLTGVYAKVKRIEVFLF